MLTEYQQQYNTDTHSLYPVETCGYKYYEGINRSKEEIKRIYSIVQLEGIKWYKEEFGILPELDAFKLNPRLINSRGRFIRRINRETGEVVSRTIEMSSYYMRHVHIEHLLNTFKHELVHYYLETNGEPFRDGTARFEAMMLAYNLTSNYRKINEPHPYLLELPKSVYYIGKWEDFTFNYKTFN